MRHLYIAGACGSIGRQTLDIVRKNKDEFKVIGLSVGVPLVSGKKRETIKFKINKQRRYELFGINDNDDFEEIDETIQEE